MKKIYNLICQDDEDELETFIEDNEYGYRIPSEGVTICGPFSTRKIAFNKKREILKDAKSNGLKVSSSDLIIEMKEIK